MLYMATVSAVCLITSVFMMHSVCNGAPSIHKNLDQIKNATSKKGTEVNGTYKYPLLKNGVFEGDIKISEELIRKYYNLSSIPGGEKYYDLVSEEIGDTTNTDVETTEGKEKFEKRAATSHSSHLWPNARVPYQFTSTVQTELRHRIRDAMNHWEDRTCLRFTTRSVENDYVEYNNEERACWSWVGRQGGNQTINVFIASDRHCSFGSVVHEVGHAIGFWHEQSRPDRDSYVRINLDNIETEGEDQFMIRNAVNSLGIGYDYGSVMHYGTTAFVRDNCDGCQTIEVTNTAAYSAQGSPTIGQKNGLSSKDVQQANLLYSCPKRGVTGLPVVHIRNAHSLPDTDPLWNSPDPYVRITAVDSSGVQYVRDTSVKEGTTSPNWNEFLKLPEREWQFFRIKLWDDDDLLTFDDDPMSVSETIVPSLGDHRNIRHCSDGSCNGYVFYDYSIYQLTSAALTVKVRYARNLQDTDPVWNSPDPYVKVEATSSSGSHALSTNYIDGTQNPTWNSVLNFGCRRWANYVQLQVWDSDGGFTGGDDEMSTKQKITISLGNHQNNRHSAYGNGYLIFDYKFIADGNECSTNPCRNGGICVDGCASYTCNCPSRYTGTNCEHFSGNLRFKARYARNLRDSDGLWNDSDPYMEIIAIDENGRSVTKSTSYLSGDPNPDWNQWLNFGIRGWKQFKVRIYDSDYDADDALSNQITWNVASGSHTGVTLNCYDGGYAVFDYYFD